LWAVPVVVVGGVGAWLAFGRGTASQQSSLLPPAAAVETVKVVTPTPAETIRLGGTTTPTRSTPPTTTTRSTGGGQAAYSIAAGRAIAVRVRAVSAGATAQELSAGDADAAAAEALARDGKYAEATARLGSATARWAAAEVAAQGRPRREGGNRGQVARNDIEQVAAEFAAAFNAKSLPRLRVVYPRMTEAQAQDWGQQFLGMRDISMQLRVSDISRAGPGEAQATFSGSYDYTEMQGGTAGSRPVNWQVTLRLGPMGWRIIALR